MTGTTGSKLTTSELAAFLELGLTARLACQDDRGWPYIVPIWHQWDGERFWIIGARNAAWVRYIQLDPQVALCIDHPATVTRVTCQGLARYIEGPGVSGQWPSIALRMAQRYLGAEGVEGYKRETAGVARWLFAIDVNRMVSWRGAGLAN